MQSAAVLFGAPLVIQSFDTNLLYRSLRHDQKLFKNQIGKTHDLCDNDYRKIVDARRGRLSISETADLLGCSHQQSAESVVSSEQKTEATVETAED